MSVPIDGDFHHTGIAAANLDEAFSLLAMLGYVPEGPEFVDERQGVRGRFMGLGGHRVEILSDLPGSQTIRPWTQHAALTPYHLAYLVRDLEVSISQLVRCGLRILRDPTPAVAFDGRRIAFLMSRSRLIIELVEIG